MKNFSRQQGDAILTTVVMLLLMTFSLFALLKIAKTDATTTGAVGWHSRAKMVSEVAGQDIINKIGAVTTALPLSDPNTSSVIAWYRDGENLPAPDDTYWASCAANATTAITNEAYRDKRCEKITQNGFDVLRVVQKIKSITIRTDTNSCYPATKTYYRIYLRTQETSGKGAKMDSEIIYWACE